MKNNIISKYTAFGLWLKNLDIKRKRAFYEAISEEIFTNIPPENKIKAKSRIANWKYQNRCNVPFYIQNQVLSIAKRITENENLTIDNLFLNLENNGTENTGTTDFE